MQHHNVTASRLESTSAMDFSRVEQIDVYRLIQQLIEQHGDDSALLFADIGRAIGNGEITTPQALMAALEPLRDVHISDFSFPEMDEDE